MFISLFSNSSSSFKHTDLCSENGVLLSLVEDERKRFSEPICSINDGLVSWETLALLASYLPNFISEAITLSLETTLF